MHPATSLALVALSSVSPSGGSDWPQFRGPRGTGVVPEAAIPLEWSETQHVAWKAEVPGQGWSQPVAMKGTVFVTTAVGEELEAPMGMAAGVADPRTMKAGTAPEVTIDWRVLALDLATGKEKWSVSAARGEPKFPIHPSNTYATETPAADADGVYAYFGATGTLAAYDHAGKPLWKAELGAYPVVQGYGTASSLALHQGRLFVQCFNAEQAFLACFDTHGGKELWRVKHEKPATSWSSPLVWHNAKRVELVASCGKLMTSHDPASGKELWRVAGVQGPSSCSFGADEERLYFGQTSPGGNPPLYALTAGSDGDLSPAQGSSDLKGQAWVARSASPGTPSPVVVDGLLYIASETLLTCRDASTGEQIYKERVPDMVTIIASPIVVGDKLLLLDEEGRAAIVQAGPEFQLVGHGKLDDLFWSTPAVAGDALLLRGAERLYCIRR